jgi:hypothetical protein
MDPMETTRHARSLRQPSRISHLSQLAADLSRPHARKIGRMYFSQSGAGLPLLSTCKTPPTAVVYVYVRARARAGRCGPLRRRREVGNSRGATTPARSNTPKAQARYSASSDS